MENLESVQKVEQQEEERAELQPEVGPAETKQLTVKCGYVVVIKDDGGLDFKIIGEQQGIIELLGLHNYAGVRLEKLQELVQKTGDALLLERMDEMQKQIDVLLGAVTRQQNK